MTELLGENIFSWMDLLTKSLQQMFCLRYGLASAVPKIYYFYGVAIFPIDNLVESLDDDASIQNRRTFKIPFGCANTGIVFEQLHCTTSSIKRIRLTAPNSLWMYRAVLRILFRAVLWITIFFIRSPFRVLQPKQNFLCAYLSQNLHTVRA